MNSHNRFTGFFTKSVSLMYILLFIYAAVSKILDFENFMVQLGQSPLLSAFAGWAAYMVPATELLIVLLLLLPKFRILGIYAAFALMVMFTSYIFIMLNFSSFVPCSCGGILEKMSWNTHLVFNLFFVFLAVAALLFQNINNSDEFKAKIKSFLKKIVLIAVLSSAVVLILFICSERIMHTENPFIRRYPQHPVMMIKSKDLKVNSYYFAGYSNGRIYLGNYTDPLHVLSFNSSLKDSLMHKISFNHEEIQFKLIRIQIRENTFYLMDGRVPAIFMGSITDWKVAKKIKEVPYFNLAVPTGGSNFVFRSNHGENASQIIGLFSNDSNPKIIYNKNFLRKQGDGVFNIDGMLLYGENLNKIVYLYYYRNEFAVGDQSLNFIKNEHTIDTNSTAKIKTVRLKNGDLTMAAPPLIVNYHSAVCDNLLFVHSKIKGKYERGKLWEQASIIDVYDIEKGTYVMSFAIYDIKKQKLGSFFVTRTHLYALINDHLVVHEINKILEKQFRLP